jgi:hypothetical protein
LNPLSNTIAAILIRMGYVYVLNRNMNTFFWNNSKLRNCLLCVFLKTVISKDWEHSFIEHDWNQRISKYQHLIKWDILLNNNINTFYWNNSKLHNILIYVLLSIWCVSYHFEDNRILSDILKCLCIFPRWMVSKV